MSPPEALESRGDRRLFAGLLLLLALAASLTPIHNYDFWWHLKTGSLILSQGAVPRVDPFSFTAAGAPWVDHEWLSQVLMHALYATVGAAGLVLLKGLAACGLAFLLLSQARREGTGPAATACLLAAALVGASFRLDVRPELATLLLLPMVFDVVLRARAGGDRRPLCLVPVLVALGANLHPGIILAPAFLLAGGVATLAIERLSSRPGPLAGSEGPRRPFGPVLVLVALAAALAVCANPYGYRIYAVPFEIRRLLQALPSPNLEWARPSFADFPLFWVSAALALAVAALGFRRLDPIATPGLLLCGVLAATHLRNIGLFFVLLPYGLAGPARAVEEAAGRLSERLRLTPPAGVRPGFIVATVVLLVSMPALAALPPAFAWGLGMAPGNEPRAAVDFVEREGIGQRLYNDVRFGGYLIWRRFPAHRVFVDGRNEIYPSLLRDVFRSLGDSRAWEAFLEGQGIDAAFLRYAPALERVVRPGSAGRPASVVERAFSVNHFPRETWALVYWDDDAMIVVRRTPANASIIARLEYVALQPEDWRYLYAAVLTGHQPVGPILEELGRKLREDPGCVLARSLQTTFEGLQRDRKSTPDAPPRGR